EIGSICYFCRSGSESENLAVSGTQAMGSQPAGPPPPPPPPPPPSPPSGSMRWILVGTAAVTVVTVLVGMHFFMRPAPAASAAAHPEPKGGQALAIVEAAFRTDIPGAELEMRGKHYTLPYAGDVTASDRPEVIVVTAPEHEGRAFKLTFDRPRRLWI